MRSVNSAFFMLLKQVYKHSRFLFSAILIFIALQLFVNFKRGVTLSPFYHYGMYSEVMQVETNWTVFEIEQNGKLLRGQDYSPVEWDKIMMPLQYFSGISKSNQLYQTDVKRLLQKLSLNAPEKNFLVNCNYQQFLHWYKGYLQNITGQTTKSLHISNRLYHFHNGSLQALDSAYLLSQICR